MTSSDIHKKAGKCLEGVLQMMNLHPNDGFEFENIFHVCLHSKGGVR